jgi:DNA-binding MarR family transcriptional regulator
VARLDAERVAVWRRLQSTAAELERLVDADVRAEWDVSLGWFDVLAALQRRGGRARPSELSDDLKVVRSSLSRRLDRLAEEGWVDRRPSPTPSDHRAVVVELTRRGRTLWREMNFAYRRSLSQHVSNRLDDADVATLNRLLHQLEP